MKNTFKKSYRLEGASYLSLSVYTTGIQKCEPLHQWGPGIRNHYLIHHIVSGKGYYKVNDNIWELHAGDTFLAFHITQTKRIHGSITGSAFKAMMLTRLFKKVSSPMKSRF